MASGYVVDASPLILLARVGRLDLLTALADEIAVPQAVLDELAAGAAQDDAARAVRELPGIQLVADLQIPEAVAVWDLGTGESQVLAHALAAPDREPLIDDRAARRCARALGIPYTGTLGVVLLCRRNGIIPAARPVVEALVAAGIRLSPALTAEALAEVGE